MFREGDSIAIREWPGQEWVVENVLVGGMGIVYICHERSSVGLGKMALKALRPDHVSLLGAKERFQQEAEDWINLGEHVNIVSAKFMVEVSHEPYIVLEYVEGGTLRTRMYAKPPMGLQKAVEFSLQICSAMQYAHSKPLTGGRKGLLHRDIKPENILIRSSDGCVKVTDFGLSRAVEGSSSVGQAGGTFQYMSPEQITAPVTVDRRSDVYSFGVTLYEMITGSVPYPELAVLGSKQPLPLNPTVPQDIASIILKCIQRDRNNRFPDFLQIKTSLENIQHFSSPQINGFKPPALNYPRNYVFVGEKEVARYVSVVIHKMRSFPEVIIRARGNQIGRAERVGNELRSRGMQLQFRRGFDNIEGREVSFIEIRARRSRLKPRRGSIKRKGTKWIGSIARTIRRLT
jgi:DNA-binding protein Alba